MDERDNQTYMKTKMKKSYNNLLDEYTWNDPCRPCKPARTESAYV